MNLSSQGVRGNGPITSVDLVGSIASTPILLNRALGALRGRVSAAYVLHLRTQLHCLRHP